MSYEYNISFIDIAIINVSSIVPLIVRTGYIPSASFL